MWYRQARKEVILPGTLPLKKDHYRGFHSILRSDAMERIPSILNEGLRIDKGLGNTYGEPNLIWGNTSWDKRYNKTAPTVEFQISPEHLKSAEVPYHSIGDSSRFYDEYFANPNKSFALRKSISPEDILSIHESWMDDVMYLLNNLDTLEYAKKAYSDLPEENQKAVDFLVEHGY
jgi:hypothetical protein